MLSAPARQESSDVQIPPPGDFNRKQLVWTKETVKAGPGKTVQCEVAKVPSLRVSDFVRGEAQLHNCSWTIVKSQKQTLQDLKGKRIHSGTALFSQTRHCSYGPADERRIVEVIDPSQRKTGSRRSKKDKGESIKAGCQAHFRLVEYVQQPGVTKIHYYSHEHLDSKGQSCHGLALTCAQAPPPLQEAVVQLAAVMQQGEARVPPRQPIVSIISASQPARLHQAEALKEAEQVCQRLLKAAAEVEGSGLHLLIGLRRLEHEQQQSICGGTKCPLSSESAK